jgi:hypothetical protein
MLRFEYKVAEKPSWDVENGGKKLGLVWKIEENQPKIIHDYIFYSSTYYFILCWECALVKMWYTPFSQTLLFLAVCKFSATRQLSSLLQRAVPMPDTA